MQQQAMKMDNTTDYLFKVPMNRKLFSFSFKDYL